MVRVWKIGAWPGGPKKNWSPLNKRRFIHEYALPKKYVAIGFKDCKVDICPDLKDPTCRHCRNKKEFQDFKKEIKQGDIVLLYNGKNTEKITGVYVGEVVKNLKKYFPGKEGQHHRIKVRWLEDKFPKMPLEADFPWNDTVHEIFIEDFKKIKDKELELKNFLKPKLSHKKSVEELEQIDSFLSKEPTPYGPTKGRIIKSASYTKDPQHNKLRDELKVYLKGNFDLETKETTKPVKSDLYGEKNGVLIIFEIKIIKNNSPSELYEAIGQLYWYSYKISQIKKGKQVVLVLCTNRKLSTEFVKFLNNKRIKYMWKCKNKFKGNYEI